MDTAVSNGWVTVFQVLAAFLGGGVVTWAADRLRQRGSDTRLRRLLREEVRATAEQVSRMGSADYVRQVLWTPIRESHPESVLLFSESNCVRLMGFYRKIDELRTLDEENADADRLDKEGKHGGAKAIRDGLGERKRAVREEMAGIGQEFLRLSA